MYGWTHNPRSGVTTHYFQEVKLKDSFKYICETCGKPRQVTIERSETVNPFNKNPDGSIKTYGEVHESVAKKYNLAKHNFEHEIHECSKCWDARRAEVIGEK